MGGGGGGGQGKGRKLLLLDPNPLLLQWLKTTFSYCFLLNFWSLVTLKKKFNTDNKIRYSYIYIETAAGGYFVPEGIINPVSVLVLIMVLWY